MPRDSRTLSDGPPEPSLGSALRDLARDDAVRARDAGARVMADVLAEFRALHVTGPRSGRPLFGWRWIPDAGGTFGLALAATLLVAVAIPLWLVSRGGVRGTVAVPGSGSGGAAEAEVTTAFLPLPYSAVPTRDAQIVRIEVPRAALGAFGLLPAGDQGSRIQDVVLADVIVGEDGLARAVRFVRAPIVRAE